MISACTYELDLADCCPPKNATLASGTYEYVTLHSQRDFDDVIKVMAVKSGD